MADRLQDDFGPFEHLDKKTTPEEKLEVLADALQQLILRKNFDMLQYFVMANVPVAKQMYGIFEYSLLHFACAVNDQRIIEFLVQQGWNVKLRTAFRSNALMKLADHQETFAEQYKFLLDADKELDINLVDAIGNSTLMRAIMAGQLHAASSLRPLGADPDLFNNEGKRALDLALEYGNARSATSLGSGSMVLVPGFISPKIGTRAKALIGLLDLALYLLIWISDVTLGAILIDKGEIAFGIPILVCALFPSIVMAMIPYQSDGTRILTILQLRLFYEFVVSITSGRLSVRYGAYNLITVGFEDIPEIVVQCAWAAQVLRHDGDFMGCGGILALALISKMVHSSQTLRQMYLQQFFVPYGDPHAESPNTYFVSSIYCNSSIILRVAMFIVLFVLAKGYACLIFVPLWLIRLRVADVFEVDPLLLDPFVCLLMDAGYVKVPIAVWANTFFTTCEFILITLISLLSGVFDVPYLSSKSLLIGIPIVWIAMVTCYAILYKWKIPYVETKITTPGAFFLRCLECLKLWHVGPQLVRIYDQLHHVRKTVAASPPKSPEEISQRQFQEQEKRSNSSDGPSGSSPQYTPFQQEQDLLSPSGTSSQHTPFQQEQDEKISSFVPPTPDPDSPLIVPTEPPTSPSVSPPPTSPPPPTAPQSTVIDLSSVPSQVLPPSSEVKEKPIEKVSTNLTLEQIKQLQSNQQRDDASGNAVDQAALARDLLYFKTHALESFPSFGDSQEYAKFKNETALTQAPGCWKGWTLNPHILGMFLNFSLYIWLIVQCFCLMIHGDNDAEIQYKCGDDYNSYYNNQNSDGFCKFCAQAGPTNFGGWGVFIALYFLYILECFLCLSAQVLAGVKPIEQAFDRYSVARGSKPGISWHVVCYHYETRTRTYTDSEGRTRTETYQERVNTHWASHWFHFDTWNDLAEPFPLNIELAKLKFCHRYSFGDDYTQKIYEVEQATFKRENFRDQYQDFWETYHVDRIAPILAYDFGKLPERLRLTWYVLASFCMGSIWFRFWMSSLTTLRKIYMLKSVRRYAPQEHRT